MYRPSIIPKKPSNKHSITTVLLIGLLVIVPLSFGLVSTAFNAANSASTQTHLSDQSDQYNQFDSEMDKIADLDFSTPPEISRELQSNIAATMSGFNAGFKENPNLADGVGYLLSSSQMDIQFSRSSVQLRIPNYGPSIESSEIPPSDQLIEADPGVISSDNPWDNKLIEDMGKPMTLKILGYTVATLEFVGSNPVDPMPQSPSSSYFNYIYGSDPDKWVKNAQSYNKLVYTGLYDNIDLVYSLKEGQLKYDFYVYPGGNYKDILLRWDGPISLQQSQEGLQMSISTPFGEQALVDSNPVNFVGTDRDEKVYGSFRVIGEETYGFSMDLYDLSELLIIDPVLNFSTFLGGSGYDVPRSLAIDDNGNVYITGSTYSTDFPTMSGTYDETYNGGSLYGYDVFVSKLSADGSALIYSTYLGGSDDDNSQSLAVDSIGNVYITGSTASTDFPSTPGAYNETFNGGNYDAFVSKLAADGSTLLFSTSLGGLGWDYGRSLAVDGNGNVYITGSTYSTDFPTTSGAYDESLTGGPSYEYDVFVSKLAADGSTLIFSTFLGGSDVDIGDVLAIDGNGDVYITGETLSTDFPTTSGAYDKSMGGERDIFVSKLSSDGSTLLFSTFLGGSGQDHGYSLVVDGIGDVYITGYTDATDFPTTLGAFDETINGNFRNDDVFVSKLAANGSTLLFSTFLGGSGMDWGESLAVDSNLNVYITGFTGSTDFPSTLGAYSETHNGGKYDGFVSKLSANGSILEYSTFLGGSGDDYSTSLATDTVGNVYITGYTNSTDFPSTTGVYDNAFNGGGDVFISKIDQSPNPPYNITLMSKANIEGNYIFLVWDEPYEGGFPITSYNVFRGTTSGSYSYLGSSPWYQPYYNDTSVIVNQPYYYVVTASNQLGESRFSSEYYITIQPTEVITETSTITDTETSSIVETSTATETETSSIVQTSTTTDTEILDETTTEKTYFPFLPVVILIVVIPTLRRRFMKN